VLADLERSRTPRQIAGRLHLEATDASVGLPKGSVPAQGRTVSHEAIYRFIYALPKGELAHRGVMLPILDEVCQLTRWHRDQARKALRQVRTVMVVRPRKARPPTCGEDMIAALRLCWAVLGTASGKRMAPFLNELVPVRGRSHTKPGSLLKDAIPVQTWADWDDVVPEFVEIDLIGHDGGNQRGEHAFTLTVTDIASGWTREPCRAQQVHNGSEFINTTCCAGAPRSGSPSPGPARATRTTGPTSSRRTGPRSVRAPATPPPHHRRAPAPGRIWARQSDLTSFFYPSRSSSTRNASGRRWSRSTTPRRPRTSAPKYETTVKKTKTALTRHYTEINPAAAQPEIQALRS